MFDIRYYMCRRGGENIYDMTKDTFHKLCPVQAFENYIGNLHPDTKNLWQKPAKKFPAKPEQKPWYHNVKVGHNTHDNFMSRLSEDCKLSRRYTNHCLCVTGITSLKRNNFSDKQVMAITGHKSVEFLAIYQRIQSDEKLMMGMCLTFSLLRPEDAVMMQNNIEVQGSANQMLILPSEIPKKHKLMKKKKITKRN